ncbi:hypothetical protein KVR01_012124 [Diaporthe batatas]|uniref:uncharacterized protein n=1 Tax=Diaporthe batatas TaxID=748121 RepID=UPI001D0379C0|nr:uncharacterized protein KVR01_012124 [Diaporthe batatas]KAG8158363.1 hypothetical protein KVR01_012124 [Diaporthe batatas]
MAQHFPRFMSLPVELQLMVFEEALMVSLSPRIVHLETELRALFAWDNNLLGWCWCVSNREQLERESPAGVAGVLQQVNSTARYAANRFLDRLGSPLSPPRESHGLMGLGLCLVRDVFWLTDELVDFIITTMGPPVDPSRVDEDRIFNTMMSLEPFEAALRWATQEGHEFTEGAEFIMFLKMLLINICDSFPAAWSLTIMVDVNKAEDISWDQIEMIRGDDPCLWRLRAGGSGKCHSLYQKYEALNREIVDEDAHRGWGGRALPELSFAYRKPVRSPARLTIE